MEQAARKAPSKGDSGSLALFRDCRASYAVGFFARDGSTVKPPLEERAGLCQDRLSGKDGGIDEGKANVCKAKAKRTEATS